MPGETPGRSEALRCRTGRSGWLPTALVLDRYFVHWLRMVTGKDGNPLNEVEMLSDSLMNNNGVLRGNNVIKLIPDQSVVKLRVGDPIRLTAAEFERLSAAFLAEMERKFL
jgi:hypothetical protein